MCEVEEPLVISFGALNQSVERAKDAYVDLTDEVFAHLNAYQPEAVRFDLDNPAIAGITRMAHTGMKTPLTVGDVIDALSAFPRDMPCTIEAGEGDESVWFPLTVKMRDSRFYSDSVGDAYLGTAYRQDDNDENIVIRSVEISAS